MDRRLQRHVTAYGRMNRYRPAVKSSAIETSRLLPVSSEENEGPSPSQKVASMKLSRPQPSTKLGTRSCTSMPASVLSAFPHSANMGAGLRGMAIAFLEQAGHVLARIRLLVSACIEKISSD